MRYSDIIAESTKTFADYGISSGDEARLRKYIQNPEYAAEYMQMGKGIEGALKYLERDRVSGRKRRARERAEEKLVSMAKVLSTRTGPISYRTACVLIANDDELFSFLNGWTWNADIGEEKPELSARFLSILKRIHPPVKKHLFRGQQAFGDNTAHTRGFHSWSANRKTAEDFAEQTGRVIEIDRPIQGVALVDIILWRMRLRDGESHYAGPQAEWFVVDQPEQFEQ